MKLLKLLISIGVSLGLLYWVAGEVDWAVVVEELKKVNYWILIPSTFLIIIHFIFRAIRWRYLLPKNEGEEVKLIKLFDAINVGNFATFILPLRAGEFIRPLLLSRWSKYGFTTSFSSVVLERFFDLAIVLLTFALLIPFIPEMPPEVHKGALVLTTLAVIILVVIAIGSFAPKLIKAISDPIFSIFPDGIERKLNHFLDEFLLGASVIKEGNQLIKIVGLSVLVWGSNYLNLYLTLYLLDITPTLVLGITVGVILALAVAAPSAPGFIGVYEWACVAGFGLFALSEEHATTYAIVTHIQIYILFVGYGVFVLLKNGLNLSQLKEAGKLEGTI